MAQLNCIGDCVAFNVNCSPSISADGLMESLQNILTIPRFNFHKQKLPRSFLYFFLSHRTSVIVFYPCSSISNASAPPLRLGRGPLLTRFLCPPVWPVPGHAPRGEGAAGAPRRRGDVTRESASATIPAAAAPTLPGAIPDPGKANGRCRRSASRAVLTLSLQPDSNSKR